MPTKLPSRIHNARCNHVVTPNLLEVSLAVGFGVELRRRVAVDGIDMRLALDRTKVSHCMVLFVGGRDILVHADSASTEGSLRGRVFVDTVAPELAFAHEFPEGFDRAYPALDALYRWAAEQGFDDTAARQLMRRVR